MTEPEETQEHTFVIPDYNTIEKQNTRGNNFLDYEAYGKVHFKVVKVGLTKPGGIRVGYKIDAVVIKSDNHSPGERVGLYLPIGPENYQGQGVRMAEFVAQFFRCISGNNDPDFNLRKLIEDLMKAGRLPDEVSEGLQAVWCRKRGNPRSSAKKRRYTEDAEGKPVEQTGFYPDDSIAPRPEEV